MQFILQFGFSLFRLVSSRNYITKNYLGPVAQRLEQGTHNPLVVGSNPTGPTSFEYRMLLTIILASVWVCYEINLMIHVGIDIFFLFYLGFGFSVILILWFYYDWKQACRYEAKRSRVIYHCIKCSRIYTGPSNSEESDCPQCGFTNGRLRF